MNMIRRTATGILALLLGMQATTVLAREMRVSTFEPPKAFIAQVMAEWIDMINPKLSKGNKFKLYPGAMLGAPPAQQELVRNGVADVAFMVTTYTPGVFPRSTVALVPFIAPTAKVGTNVIETLREEGLLGDEYDDFKVIGVFTTQAYTIFTKNKKVETPKDIAGLKLRTHAAFASDLLEMMDASGVSIPAPQVFEAVERGVADGAIFNFTAAKDFRMDEVNKYATYVPLTNTVLAILMNRKTYEGLPEADRAVIDKYSGRWFADWIADLNDKDEYKKRDQMRAKGIVITEIADEDAQAWKDATSKGEQLWLKQMSEQGIDGKPILARAREIAAQMTK